ncbi:MAG: serine hydrolase domain-containing protein [Planctomycetales bacterium]
MLRSPLVFFCLLLGFSPLLAAEPVVDPWKAKVDELAQPLVKSKPGLVIGILTPDGVRKVYGYGVIQKDGPAPDGKTLFEIGSISKTFTALLLADAVVRGEVKLDDPVQKCFSLDWKIPKRGEQEITLRELATHTSGLPRIPSNLYWGLLWNGVAGNGKMAEDPYSHLSQKKLREGLADLKLGKEKKPACDYSNLGMGLVGEALASKAKLSFEELIRTRIGRPLGLRDTVITPTQEQLPRFATGHKGKSIPVDHWTFASLQGCGAIISTADDMLEYLAAEVGQKPSSLDKAMALTQERRENFVGKIGIGLAWLIVDLPEKKQRYWWHNGGTGGFTSYCAFSQEPRVAVVILCNSGVDLFSGATDKLGEKLIRLLMDGPSGGNGKK